MSFLRAPEDDLTLEAALAFLDEYDNSEDLLPICPETELQPLEPEDELLYTPTSNNTNNTNDTNKTNALRSVHAETATSFNGDTLYGSVKTGPKRVRKRQKDELIYLRCRASELEDRLARLQKKGDGNGAPSPQSPTNSSMSSMSTSSGGDEAIVAPTLVPPFTEKPSAQLAAVWEKVAERQHAQRQQAEIENAKLKELLEDQLRLARSLERVLRRRTNDSMLQSNKPTKHFTWNRVATKEEEAVLFQDMLQGLANQYLESLLIFSPTRFPTSKGPILREITVRMTGEDPVNLPGEEGMGEMYIDVHDSKLLPFNFESTAAAFWQHMTRGRSTVQALYQDLLELTDDTMARSFNVEIKAGPMQGEFRGQQCVRRYQEENRVVMVWTMLAEPLEVAGIRMGGLRMRQKAWVELTPSIEDPKQATQVRARYMMTPDVQNEENDDGRKVGALTDFVIHSAHGNLNASHERIENMLVQAMLQDRAITNLDPLTAADIGIHSGAGTDTTTAVFAPATTDPVPPRRPSPPSPALPCLLMPAPIVLLSTARPEASATVGWTCKACHLHTCQYQRQDDCRYQRQDGRMPADNSADVSTTINISFDTGTGTGTGTTA